MTTSLDQSALYASILSHPDEDTPRLMFADYLDEHGNEQDRDRAELIRVQCESAMLLVPSPVSDDVRRTELRARETALIAEHGAAWRKGPVCGKCGGSGEVGKQVSRSVRQIDAKCPDCHGTGDAGGLTWPLTRGTGSGGSFVRETNWPLVTFRRGFPAAVTCPRLVDALEEEEREFTNGADFPCRIAPTRWLAAVLSAHPVAEVVPGDREPTREEGGWEWYDLPDQLNTMRTKQTFATPELAKSALGQEIVYVGRTKR